MKYRLLPLAGFILGVLSLMPVANAAFIIRVGDGTVPDFVQGQQSVLLPVYIYEGTTGEGTGKFLDGFTLGFDFDSANQPGAGLRSGFTFVDPLDTIAPVFDAGGAVQLDPNGNNYDILSSAGSNTANVISLGGRDSSNPVKLFDIKFDIGANAQTGLYSVTFVPNALQNNIALNDLTGMGTNTITPNLQSLTGQFNITAVPEPGTLGLASLVGAMGVGVLRRRRKRSK